MRKFLLLIAMLISCTACRKDEPQTAPIAMVGDSMTKRGDWSNLLKQNVYNFGIDGLKSAGVKNNTISKAIDSEPSFVYLMIGFNDADNQPFNLDIYKSNMNAIVDSLKLNNIQFAIQSVLPATLEYNQSIGLGQTNDNIYLINIYLEELCLIEGVEFIDLRPLFVLDNSYLNPELSTDGVHLNEKGYKIWSEYLISVTF